MYFDCYYINSRIEIPLLYVILDSRAPNDSVFYEVGSTKHFKTY